MNCEDTRAALREQFDAGRPLGARLEDHLRSCEACRAYRERLETLDRCLARLPLESPAPGFAARIGKRIDTDAARRRRAEYVAYGAGAVVAVALAAVQGWLYPIDLEPREWALRLQAALPDVQAWDWRAVLSGAVDGLRHAAADGLSRLPSVPALAAWPLAAALALFLVVFNGIEARRAGRDINGGR